MSRLGSKIHCSWRRLVGLLAAALVIAIGVRSPVVSASDGPDANSQAASAGAVAATLTWDLPAPMPDVRQGYAAAEAAGKIYLVGGSDSHGTTAIVDVFDPIANTWTTGPNLPTPRNNPGAVTLDGKLFVVGGSSNDGSRLATAEEFDPSTNTWTELPPMPTARSYPALVAGPDGRLYAIGGASLTYGESLSRAVESFDPTTRTWSVQAPLPAPPDTYDQTYYQSGAAVGGGGRIYVLGAEFSSSGRTTRLDAYDPAVNQWTTIQNATNVPSYGNWTAVVAGADGRIYAFRTTVDVYSPISNAWTTVRPVPGIPSQGLGPAAVGPDGRIYLFPVGGFSMYDTEVAVYNPTTNVWIPYPPMPT
ncbi:MAG TPA: kelch repeat-containing protein, partial [Chloroflexota bacterium]|nr:kelch repeat-containing protein [Chloroflexota bacterium]